MPAKYRSKLNLSFAFYATHPLQPPTPTKLYGADRVSFAPDTLLPVPVLFLTMTNYSEERNLVIVSRNLQLTSFLQSF